MKTKLNDLELAEELVMRLEKTTKLLADAVILNAELTIINNRGKINDCEIGHLQALKSNLYVRR